MLSLINTVRLHF